MTKPFLILLAAAGAALLVVLLKFGTIDPCGILRAQIRQDAAREGGFGVVASALPDSVIDGIMAVQYGPLSPGRCIALAFAGAPAQTPTAPSRVPSRGSPPAQPQAGQQGGFPPQNVAAALKQAGEEAKTAMMECKNKRLSGELKTHMASAECSNPQIVAAFQRAGYRYMDLIHLFTAKRRAVAEQVDKGTLTEAQAELEAAQFMVRIDDEERQRDRGQH
jgi:hypothetical protein